MKSEYKLVDSFNDYIKTIREDIEEYANKITYLYEKNEELYNFIIENKFEIDEYLSLNIDKYPIEIAKRKYNPEKSLYKLAYKIYTNLKEDEYKKYVLQIIKYCQNLERIDKLEKLLEISKKRNRITYNEYFNHLKKYYYKIHEHLLKGEGYKYQYGLGIFFINRFILNDNNNRSLIDYVKTRENKQEIINRGLIPYNGEDAREAKILGREYNGVEYMHTITELYWFGLDHFKSGIENLTKMKYFFNNQALTCRRYRGLPYKQIADLYVTKPEELFKLSIDIRKKVSLMFYKFPEMGVYINRYVKTSNNEYRKNYRKNRQRFQS